MTTQMMTVNEAAAKWFMNPQAVRVAIRQGRIPGAVQDEKGFWAIPADEPKPLDRRTLRKKLVDAPVI